MKALNIISSAHRATLEEQDDTVVWLSLAMRAASANIDVVLRGAAASYAFSGQEVAPVMFGNRRQSHAPDIHGEVSRLIAGGAKVFVMAEDVEQRGLDPKRLMAGAQTLPAADFPALVADYECVWNW